MIVDKIIIKIDFLTLYYNLRYTLFTTILGVSFLTFSSVNMSSKLFGVMIWIAIFYIPIIYVLMGYLTSNFGQTIELTSDYFIMKKFKIFIFRN